MSQYWDTLAARSNGQHTADEFEMAAYRLVTEQVLYYADHHSRAVYWIAERYERELRQALAPLGVMLKVNRQLRYVYASPNHAKATTATTVQTLLALVLRSMYEESGRAGRLNADGEVICDLVELEEKYRLSVNRPLPSKGELNGVLKVLKRWGIAKKEVDPDDATQPFVIVIRPAIIDILNETALDRLAHWQSDEHSNDPHSDASNENDDDKQLEDQ